MSSHQSFWVSVYLCGAFLLIPPSVDRHPHGFNLHRAPAELAHLQSPTSLTARLHDDISLQGYMRFFPPHSPQTETRIILQIRGDEFIYSVSPNAFPSSNPSLLIPLNATTISEGFPFMVPPPPHLLPSFMDEIREGGEERQMKWSVSSVFLHHQFPMTTAWPSLFPSLSCQICPQTLCPSAVQHCAHGWTMGAVFWSHKWWWSQSGHVDNIQTQIWSVIGPLSSVGST